MFLWQTIAAAQTHRMLKRWAFELFIVNFELAALLAPVRCGELACQRDSYAKACKASVLSCTKAAAAGGGKKKKKAADVYEVVLSDTVLFPEGGGQPSDIGTVGGVVAQRVDNVDGVAVHKLAAPVEVGAELEVSVGGRVARGERLEEAAQVATRARGRGARCAARGARGAQGPRRRVRRVVLPRARHPAARGAR